MASFGGYATVNDPVSGESVAYVFDDALVSRPASVAADHHPTPPLPPRPTPGLREESSFVRVVRVIDRHRPRPVVLAQGRPSRRRQERRRFALLLPVEYRVPSSRARIGPLRRDGDHARLGGTIPYDVGG